ncbi:MAG: HPr kinase/phosphorylase [Alphaproteobacteria bacterium]
MKRGDATDTIHASAVVVGDRGVLIRGPSGSGKSSLALGLIDDARLEARLIADDRLVLAGSRDGLIARTPERLEGLIEVRGIGIVKMPHIDEAKIVLVVDLLRPEDCFRYPGGAERNTTLMGHLVPRLTLPIGVADGVTRVRVALREWSL